MSYNLNELAVIQQLAQGLAQTADRMAMMIIYSGDPSLHSDWLTDRLQAAFSELHSTVLGLEAEALTEAHRAPDYNQGE